MIADTFRDGESGQLTHGVMVAESALSEGYHGHLCLRPFLPDDRAVACKAEQAMLSTSAPCHRFLQAVRQAAVEGQSELLEAATTQLRQLKRAGSHHGAVSFSVGDSKARIFEQDYAQLSLAWDWRAHPQLREQSQRLLGRYAAALGLDMQKLQASDPGVLGPERARLQQGLLAQIDAAVDHSARLKTARADYARCVDELEGQRVSVVVAADNQGELLQKMTADANGRPPQVSADFFENPLSNARTVTVGAVGSLRDGRGDLPGVRAPVAYYSSPSRQVSVYANGVTGDEDGTSFATPRVAAVLAELHRTRPQASNRQVTAEMLDRLCQDRALDASRAASFLSEQ